MKKFLIVLLLILVLAACGGSPSKTEPNATASVLEQEPSAATIEVSDESTTNPAEGLTSGLPIDLETYYKTIVFIEGTAQLMSKFDIAALRENNTGMLALIAIPGIMDDRIIATEQTPLPAGLDAAWSKALEARDGILMAYETLLTTWLQEDYTKQLSACESLASEAKAETEVLLASGGASEDSIALANRAALTEMGEAYQSYVSMILVGESESNKNTE